jgi:hypothetical protein
LDEHNHLSADDLGGDEPIKGADDGTREAPISPKLLVAPSRGCA